MAAPRTIFDARWVLAFTALLALPAVPVTCSSFETAQPPIPAPGDDAAVTQPPGAAAPKLELRLTGPKLVVGRLGKTVSMKVEVTRVGFDADVRVAAKPGSANVQHSSPNDVV